MKTLIFFLLISGTLFAQTSKDTSKNNSQTNIQQNQDKKDTTQSKDLYKMLYEETKETNDKLVKTVLWTLGVIVTIALLLVGYNVLYNFKINKDQIDNINKEVDNKIEKVRNEGVKNLNTRLDDNKKEFEERINIVNKEFNDTLSTKIQSLTDTYEKQTNAYKESTELQVKTLEKSIEERTKNLNASIEIFHAELKRSILEVDQKIDTLGQELNDDFNSQVFFTKRELYYAKAEIWQINKVPINELRAYIDSLEIEINFGSHVISKLTLSCIEECLTRMTYFYKGELNKL